MSATETFKQMLAELQSINGRLGKIEQHNAGVVPVMEEHGRRLGNLEEADKIHEKDLNECHTKHREQAARAATAKWIIGLLGVAQLINLLKAFS